jgi:hypothetical protein
MNDCTHFKKKCTNCNQFGHEETTCRFEKMNKKYKSGKSFNSGHRGKRRHTESKKAHQSEETAYIKEVEEVVFQTTECEVEDTFEGAKYYDFNTDVPSYENDECLIYYDCLADSTITSHVLNQREAFISFEASEKTMVGGVGGIKTHAEGRGTVQLESTCNRQKFTLTLKDVLYIPNNKNNLISLECWEAAGGRYAAHDGMLMLSTKNGNPCCERPSNPKQPIPTQVYT